MPRKNHSDASIPADFTDIDENEVEENTIHENEVEENTIEDNEVEDESLSAEGQTLQVVLEKTWPLTVKATYAEGHVLSAAEARELNLLRIQKMRNIFVNSKWFKKQKPEELTVEILQAKFAELDAKYELGKRQRLTTGIDPIRRLALKNAAEIVKTQLRKLNYKMSDITVEQINALALDLLEKNPSLLEKARERYEEDLNTGAQFANVISLPVVPQAPEEPSAEPAH